MIFLKRCRSLMRPIAGRPIIPETPPEKSQSLTFSVIGKDDRYPIIEHLFNPPFGGQSSLFCPYF